MSKKIEEGNMVAQERNEKRIMAELLYMLQLLWLSELETLAVHWYIRGVEDICLLEGLSGAFL